MDDTVLMHSHKRDGGEERQCRLLAQTARLVFVHESGPGFAVSRMLLLLRLDVVRTEVAEDVARIEEVAAYIQRHSDFASSFEGAEKQVEHTLNFVLDCLLAEDLRCEIFVADPLYLDTVDSEYWGPNF